MKNVLIALCAGFLSLNLQAQLVVDSNVNQQDAVQNILLGEGIEATNITFSGDANQIGSFDSSNSNIPLASGVIIATGDIAVAVGPNNQEGATLGGGNVGASDPDLAQLIPGFTLNDAAILEFDFIATGDSVSFRYVFASEEYPEFVFSSFNDVFGFFLSGPGINGPFSLNAINIALIPGTTQPVTIDTVNDQVNSQFYIDNNSNTSPTATQMNGFTVALRAEAGGLLCGETYHIKIAIADAGDTSWDSCVFLEAGSFASNEVSISVSIPNTPPGFPPLTLLEGCIDGVITIFRPSADENDQIALVVGGTATPGDDYEELPEVVTFAPGELTVEIPIITFYDGIVEDTETIIVSYDFLNACGDEESVQVVLNLLDYNPPQLDLPEEIYLCGGESIQVSAVPEDGFAPFNYAWTTGATSSSITVSGGGPEQIAVIVIDYCGFEVDDAFIVVIPDPLVVPIDAWVCVNAPIELLVSGGAPPYEWTYDEELLTFSNGQFTSNTLGFYTISVIDQCNVGGSFELEVKVCDTEIPNIFSPNNDGQNDRFAIRGWEGFPNSRLEVYNRWGTLVFEDDNYRSNWAGEDMAEGTYFYIYYRDDGETFNGYFQLVRTTRRR